MLVRRRDAVPERPAEFEFAPIYGLSRAVEQWRIIGLVMAMKHRMRVAKVQCLQCQYGHGPPESR
jgi:hypothetical protein